MFLTVWSIQLSISAVSYLSGSGSVTFELSDGAEFFQIIYLEYNKRYVLTPSVQWLYFTLSQCHVCAVSSPSIYVEIEYIC